MIETKTILVDLSISSLPKTKKSKVGTKTSREILEAKNTVNIINFKWPESFEKLPQKIRNYHNGMTLPWASTGARVLAMKNLDEYREKMATFKRKYNEEKTMLLKTFDDWASMNKSASGKLSVEVEKYLESARIHIQNMEVIVTFLPVPTVDDFRIEIEQEMKKEIEESLQKAQQETIKGMVKRLLEPIAKMGEVLSEPDRIFRNSLVGNIEKAIKVADASLCPELEWAFEEARELLKDPDSLRASQTERQETAERANDLAKRISEYI